MAASKCTKCQRYCRLVATFLFSHVGLCALVVGYSIIGALTFEALEAKHELAKREAMLKERESVVEGLWHITARSEVLSEHNWSAMATEALQEFEATLVFAVRKEGYDGKDESPLQWTFSGALLYSIIVITTIGYGNIAPKTPWGKVVTLLYAIVGIPLLLLCLSNIGDAMAHSFKFIYWKVCCYLCVRPNKKRRKRSSTHRPRVPVPYRQPVVHQQRSPPPPVCSSPVPESPPLHSSSTYHTAPTSSPTISSPASTPSSADPASSSASRTSAMRWHTPSSSSTGRSAATSASGPTRRGGKGRRPTDPPCPSPTGSPWYTSNAPRLPSAAAPSRNPLPCTRVAPTIQPRLLPPRSVHPHRHPDIQIPKTPWHSTGRGITVRTCRWHPS